MELILRVEGLEKKYPRFSLKKINIELKKGCITGFIGINGAGKTTTLKSILGLNNIDAGEITFWGKSMLKNSQEIKNRIGVVLGESCFYETLTIAEMKSIIAPVYSEWNEHDFASYLEKFSLSKKQQISTLSKGMKMKVALAISLSHNAELLIMDEPTSGLDPLIRKQLMGELLEFMKKNNNNSIFFSTHITSDLDRVADELILIDDGKIIFSREKDELIESHRVVKGNNQFLDEKNKNYFKTLQISEYGFKGLTDNINLLQKNIRNITTEKPAIEDIMLAYIGKN